MCSDDVLQAVGASLELRTGPDWGWNLEDTIVQVALKHRCMRPPEREFRVKSTPDGLTDFRI